MWNRRWRWLRSREAVRRRGNRGVDGKGVVHDVWLGNAVDCWRLWIGGQGADEGIWSW